MLKVCELSWLLLGISVVGVQGNDVRSLSSEQPVFLTPGQKYRIAVGATVILPCRISQTGFVLAWKKGTSVLTAGNVQVTPDPRLKILSNPVLGSSDNGPKTQGGYSLELRDVKPQDAGDYICQLGTIEPKEIIHTLEILVPAKIIRVSHQGIVEAVQGQRVEIKCIATGNPLPIVSWTKVGGRTIDKSTMVLDHIDRHSAGQYQCNADNGVGEADKRFLDLKVSYPPEIEVEKSIIHTGVGLEAQLVCSVHAEPSAQVTWYKKSTQIGPTHQHVFQNRGNKFTLIIKSVSIDDIGNYSCLAANVHGKSRGYILLTGLATTASISSPSLGNESTKYFLSWSVESHSPIIEYRLFYRSLNGGWEEKAEAGLRVMKVNGTGVVQMKPEWFSMNIAGYDVIPQHYFKSPSKLNIHKMTYTVPNLLPSTTYEVRVQAKNELGWNDISPVFHFTTKSNDVDNMIEPSAQPAVYGYNLAGFFSSSPKIHMSCYLWFLGVCFYLY